MKPELLLALVTAVGGLGAIVFAALRFNREDAGQVVQQQSTLLNDMRVLNDELQEALGRARDDLEGKENEIKHAYTDLSVARARVAELEAEHAACDATVRDLERRLIECHEQRHRAGEA